MSKKSTTDTSNTTSGTTNVTQTPTNPAWVEQGIAGLGGTVNSLAAQDPYSFVAGPDALQTQAGANAAGLTGTPWSYDQSAALANGVGAANAPSIAGNISQFMDPYENAVVDTTLQGFDKNAGYTRAQDSLAKAGDSTFGGSGGAIQTALNEQNIAQGRAQTEAQLRSAGFTQALNGATSQAQLDQQQQAQRLAAAGLLTSNADSFGNTQRANATTQSQIGQMLQQLAQNKATAPITTAGALTSILGGLPLSLLHGQDTSGATNSTSNGTSTTSVSDPLGTIGSLVSAGGSLASGLGSMGLMFSDRRLKRDIKRVGELDDGLGVFSYRYKAGGPKQIGVMAQEVQKTKPHAVHDIGGLLAVDYGAL